MESGLPATPSDEVKKQRATTLTYLQNLPAPQQMLDFFETLKQASPQKTEDTFILGIKRFASILGSSNMLSGLHLPAPWIDQWNQKYPHLATTVWDQDFQRQCPHPWSHELETSGENWALVYLGEGSLSQALNELVKGPTTLDCGMFSQLIIWMAIRYLLGDERFDQVFQFAKGRFVLTQDWNWPMNDTDSTGNLLYHFYDKTPQSDSRARVKTRTIWNHATYLEKHPGGMGMLHNITQVDGNLVVFAPGEPCIMNEARLEQMSREAYNAPRNLADSRRLQLWEMIPDYVHPDFSPKSYRDLINEAENYENAFLDEQEWEKSRCQREEKNLSFEFNFSRLVHCLEQSEHASVDESVTTNILKCAERSHELASMHDTLNKMENLLSTLKISV